MPALSLRSLRKSFLVGATSSPRRIDALNGVDLDVEEGEILGVLGGAQAGKTTLLLCAAGLLRRDSGTISWHGERFSGGSCPRGIAYVPPAPTYYPFLSVRDVLSSYGARDIRAAARCACVTTEVVARFSLTSRMGVAVSELATDELKRVGIAQAFVEDPKILFLDGTLDGIGVEARETHPYLESAAASGATIVITSRDAAVLAAIATRIVVMERGRIAGSFSAVGATPDGDPAHTLFSEVTLPIRQIAERVH
jgi:ABC-2 type transport system ATP-binding protein